MAAFCGQGLPGVTSLGDIACRRGASALARPTDQFLKSVEVRVAGELMSKLRLIAK